MINWLKPNWLIDWHDKRKIFWTFLQANFQTLILLWSLVLIWYWIETGGGGGEWRSIITAITQTWAGHNRNSEVSEGERGMAFIKPSPVSLGRICEQWDRALGQKQEPDEPMTVSIILLNGVSVSWDAGCWSYSSCRVTVPVVSCEHAYDNKEDMWTKSWGSRLLTPLCTGQLDCNPSS